MRGLCAALIVLSSLPAVVWAQPVEGVLTPVAVRPFSQTDPHISGTVISYTDSDGSHERHPSL